MATTPNHYIVILCGGTGPRLWPLSRAYHPKQFLSLFGKKSLLEQTVNRAQNIVSLKKIFIISNNRYQAKLENYISKKIPQENIIYEPIKKNTAMAILLATCLIKTKDPKAIITTMPSDHYIKQTVRFKSTIKQATSLANRYKQIITIGIKPTSPNPSLGYIVPQKKNQKFSQVNLFIEKPDIDTAQILIKKGSFWNSGIYTFSVSTLINEFQNLQPEFKPIIDKLLQSKNISKTINEVYKIAPNIAIDQAISEKTHNLFVVPIKSDWSDVGEWNSIYQKLAKDKLGIAQINQDSHYLQVDSKNCLISAPKNKIVSLIDVENLAIIDTPDGLLICNMSHNGSAKVRDIVKQIVKNKKYHQFFLKKHES